MKEPKSVLKSFALDGRILIVGHIGTRWESWFKDNPSKVWMGRNQKEVLELAAKFTMGLEQ